MIIYNITTLVSWPIHEDWREWLFSEFLPELMETQLFSHFQVVRLLEVNEDEGPTYAVQLYLKMPPTSICTGKNTYENSSRKKKMRGVIMQLHLHR